MLDALQTFDVIGVLTFSNSGVETVLCFRFDNSPERRQEVKASLRYAFQGFLGGVENVLWLCLQAVLDGAEWWRLGIWQEILADVSVICCAIIEMALKCRTQRLSCWSWDGPIVIMQEEAPTHANVPQIRFLYNFIHVHFSTYIFYTHMYWLNFYASLGCTLPFILTFAGSGNPTPAFSQTYLSSFSLNKDRCCRNYL